MAFGTPALVPPNFVIKILLFVFIGLLYLGVPFFIYFYIGFHKLSDSIMIKKRYPTILRMQAIFLLLSLIVIIPLMLADFAYLEELQDYQAIISRVDQTVFHFGPYGFFLTITWRFWHIFFDLKYASSQKNSEWKYHLDPNLVQHNFWLTHKGNYGSVNWMSKRFYVFFIVTASLQSIVFQIVTKPIIGYAVSFFFITLSVSMIFFAWIKKPQYSDSFFIGKELKTLAFGAVGSLPVTTGAICYGIFASPQFLFFILTMYTAILLFTASWFSFWFIPRKIFNEEERMKLIRRFGLGEDSVLSRSKSSKRELGGIVRRLSNIPGAPKKLTFQLDSVISVEKTFKMFMQHLAKEFSTECLLCFVEVVQYKYMMRQRVNVIDRALIPSKQNFAEACPLSNIVRISAINRDGFLRRYHARDDPTGLIEEAKGVCRALYKKYISEGSELEINISYQQRSRLSSRMANPPFFQALNISVNELFAMYDAVAETMYRLMDGSFLRFRQAETWDTVKEILTAENEENIRKAEEARKAQSLLVQGVAEDIKEEEIP